MSSPMYTPGAERTLGSKDRPTKQDIPDRIGIIENSFYAAIRTICNAEDPKGPKLQFENSPKVRR